MRNPAWLLVLAPALCAQESIEVTGGLRGMVDEYLTVIAREHWNRRATEMAAIRTVADVKRRQTYIREKFMSAIGGFPERTALNARITGSLERDRYRVEKLVYESLPGFHVTANVYVPKGGRPPFPAVLGVAGHSEAGKAAAIYQRAWIGMARRGILVLAFDPPGQGERTQYFDPEIDRSLVGGSTSEHTMAGLQCLLTGTNYARYETWDGVRAVDYLLTRSDVDPQRIGVAGNSGGGTQSAYLAVAEPRLAAAAPSCYITSWEAQWSKPGPQDAEQNFARFVSDGLDHSDFLIAFAPRPIHVAAAIRDFFPIDGARAAWSEARRIYELMDARDRIGFFEYDDTHGWSKPRREATYRWFGRWLNGASDEGIEGEYDTEPESALVASLTGQVATSYHGQTVQSLNLSLAAKMHGERRALSLRTPEEIRGLVASRLGLERHAGPPKAAGHGAIGRDGYRIEKLLIDSEPGIRVPALLFVGAAGEPKRAAVLYLDSRGKAADARPGGDIEALVRTGRVVLSIDPRGWGETRPGPERGAGYGAPYQTFMRAMLVGKTMAGMQLTDVFRAFEFLRTVESVDAARIAILGKESGGVLAQLAAALEPRFERIASEGAVISYHAIARARQHEGLIDTFVPGVLADFDLPDLARAIAPRKLWIVDPRTPTRTRMPLERAANEYGGAHVAGRPEGWPFERVYAGWLR